MPGENIQDWSVTAASNGTADSSINFAEGQTRASLNNSCRSVMAAVAKDRNLKNGSITTGGSANALTFQSGLSYASVPTGLVARLKFSATNTLASPTLSMDGLSFITIKNLLGADLAIGDLVLGAYGDFLYNGTNWIILNSYTLAVYRTGGTMTGDLTISKSNPNLILNKSASAQAASVIGQTGALIRWLMQFGNGSAESGSDVGSDFILSRYTDAGAVIDSPLFIKRSSGIVSLGPTTNGSIFDTGGGVNVKAAAGAHGVSIGASTAASFSPLVFYNSSSSIIGSVDCTTSATAYTTSSDARLKTDIRPFERGRAILEQLAVKDFTWKQDGYADVGLIAQEVDAVFPNAVGKGSGHPGDPDFVPFRLDYSKLVPVLIGALQDAFRRIEALESR